MRQLKVKSLDEQFKEYVDCVYECFDECPERPDALFRAYTFLSNALDISLNTVDVLVWGIKNNGGTYSAHEVAMKASISEWEAQSSLRYGNLYGRLLGAQSQDEQRRLGKIQMAF